MDITNLNNGVTNINKLNFANIWKGSAYDSQSEQLNDMMKKLNECITDISKFDDALELKEKYIEICDRIVTLYSSISSCSKGHGTEQENNGCSACSSYKIEINQKEAERKELREKIISILGCFKGIEAEISEQFDFGIILDELDENITDFPDYPLYDQTQYDDPFGAGTISSEGCGITCAAMLISYYTGQTVTPSDIANNDDIKWNGNDGAMQNALDYYNINWANNWRANGKFDEGVDMYYNNELTEKLKEGYTAIILMNECNYTGPDNPGGGHFVLATGITEDGKIIIQDPYGPNYQRNDPIMADGLENGFDYNDIDHQMSGFWLIESPETYQEREMPKAQDVPADFTPTMVSDPGFYHESDTNTGRDDGFYEESNYNPGNLEYR